MDSHGEDTEKDVKFRDRVIAAPFIFFGAIATCIILLVTFIVMVPVIFVGRLAELRLRMALKREGRVLDWETVEKRLQDGQGTLLMEWWWEGQGRAWWIPCSLSQMCSDVPLVSLSEMETPVDEDSVPVIYEQVMDEDTTKWLADTLAGHEDEFCLTRVPWRERKEIHILGQRLGADRAFVFSAVSKDAPTRHIKPKSWKRRGRKE